MVMEWGDGEVVNLTSASLLRRTGALDRVVL